jgi:acetylornithine aminotransferase/acetylornithine/N-succinyldiaminopimelate aminotransferase
MKLASVQRAEASLLVPTYDRYPVLLERGRGVYLYDAKGRRYLDFLSGIGVNALGYAHPAIQKVIAKQAGRLIHVSNLFFHPYQAELAERLTKISGLERVFFCNSGTEAWEGALKLARAHARAHAKNGHRPKWKVLVMQDSFHGRTLGSLTTTGQEKYRAPFRPLLPGVSFVRWNDVADLKRKFDDEVCAIGLETVQGEGGVRPVDTEFLRTARALTKKSGALLLLDEIQCGLGRTGRYFAYQHYGLKPDLVTVAKPLAAGLPLGAILTTDKVAASMHPGMHGTTFGGGPLACATAIAFLKTLERESLLENVRKMGHYFRAKLEGLAKKHASIRNVRGLGLMLAVELDSADDAKAAVRTLLERGIIINRTHDTVLRFLPPFIIRRPHVDELIAALDNVLSGLAARKRQTN